MESINLLKINGEREYYCKKVVKPRLLDLKSRLVKYKDEKEKAENEINYTTMLKLYSKSLGVTPERLEKAVFGVQ